MIIPPDDLVNYIFLFLGICLALCSLGLVFWWVRKERKADETRRILAMRDGGKQ